MLFTLSYSESAYLITLVEQLKPSLYNYFVISVYFVYFIFIQTTINLHLANSKVRNSDFAYSICFSQVLLKLFTFLINTADKEIYNISIVFLFPYYFNTNRTNKHTNNNRVLIIKIVCAIVHSSIILLAKCIFLRWIFSINIRSAKLNHK